MWKPWLPFCKNPPVDSEDGSLEGYWVGRTHRSPRKKKQEPIQRYYVRQPGQSLYISGWYSWEKPKLPLRRFKMRSLHPGWAFNASRAPYGGQKTGLHRLDSYLQLLSWLNFQALVEARNCRCPYSHHKHQVAEELLAETVLSCWKQESRDAAWFRGKACWIYLPR